MTKLVLLDSASLWFRAFYALPESMTAPDGTPVNAVRGFADMVAKIITERRPSRLVACLDADWRPAFRVEALPSYKAHRVAEPDINAEEVPDTLTPQVPVILELLDALGIATAEAAGYEADDVIGALATAEDRDPVEVVTGDRDLFQLVREEPTAVRVMYTGKGIAKAEFFGPVELAERYSLPVDRAGPAYADMAALRGDPSDGLPGVAGIGEKTAAGLITAVGSVEDLLAALDDPADTRIPARSRGKLEAARDYLTVAPKVVRVAVDAPVSLDRDDVLPNAPVDLDRVRALQEQWGLSRSVDRIVAALS
ncbi:5'-3' exonuclease [Allokutzneria sp. A3M-2-11 16]|uniref:5'-3' exonuclease n=1 Tax=Allokutzneria sp. A3M-2-11 16 TaxID=2962043 RepID=UPI0020B767CB|nr:5'-3' exonuclease [Allokutzneria sp. A3M-2-11 16]MCP3803725.1 5'-3' exonuclease [Allokutzneria sp. A3M-2-11 16]